MICNKIQISAFGPPTLRLAKSMWPWLDRLRHETPRFRAILFTIGGPPVGGGGGLTDSCRVIVCAIAAPITIAEHSATTRGQERGLPSCGT